MPCRSASASLPVAIWYSLRRCTSEAIAYGDEQSMRILPSQSSVMNPNCGSTFGLTTVRSSPCRSAIAPQYATLAPPIGSAPIRIPASRIAAMLTTEGRSSTYRPRKSYFSRSPRTESSERRRTPSSFAASSSFARFAIHLVASVSAGPPFGGLYLKPPSWGGVCDGVMTTPSASPAARLWLWARIACDTAGVGVNPPALSTSTVTSFATRTSTQVSHAGPESAWVSAPTNSGPSVPSRVRYSTIACVVAAMWSSLNEVFSDVPRWPEVPNATACSGFDGSGCPSWYALRSFSTSTRSAAVAGVPARESVDIVSSPRLGAGGDRTRGCCGTPCHPAPTLRSVEPVAHGPRLDRGMPDVPRWGGLESPGVRAG